MRRLKKQGRRAGWPSMPLKRGRVLDQQFDEINSEQRRPRYLNEDAKNPPAETSWGKLLRWVPEGSLVLEVGCGHGSFSSALRTHRGCRVVGVEIDAERAA